MGVLGFTCVIEVTCNFLKHASSQIFSLVYLNRKSYVRLNRVAIVSEIKVNHHLVILVATQEGKYGTKSFNI